MKAIVLHLFAAACGASLAISAMTAADTPSHDAFTYQGQLKHNGDPVTGSVNFAFRLYDAEAGGTQIGPELTAIGFDEFDDEGRFTMDLEFGKGLFDGTPLWLEVWVAGAPLTPRQPIMPTPYSIRALNVATVADGALGGTYTGQLNLNNAGNQFIGSFTGNGSALTGLNASAISSGTLGGSHLGGTYSNALTLNNAGNQFTGAFAGSGASLTNLNASNIASGTLNVARLPTGGNWNLTSNLNIGTGIMFLDNTNTRVGIGTNSPQARLNVNGDAGEVAFRAQLAGLSKLIVAPTGGVSVGANLTTPPTDGLYVHGNLGLGTSTSTRRLAIVDPGLGFDRPSVNNLAIFTANTERVRINEFGRMGINVTNPTSRLHLADSTTGRVLEAENNNGSGTGLSATIETGGTGTGIGVRAWVDPANARAMWAHSGGSSGTGVYARVTHATSTNAKAIHGDAWSDTAYAGYFEGGRNYFEGRVGIGTATPGNLLHVTGAGTTIRGISTSFDGVEGRTGTSGAYGVYGVHSDGGRGVVGSATGTGSWAVYAFGNSGATGTKSFKIDHPLDPENKYLLHYSAEGPEPYTLYRGNVQLDAFGEAWVDLPDYFQTLNRDFHYQLTSIGAPGPNLHVAVEIENNMFFISGGSPGSKVSWTVTAVRNDPHVREYPTTDERMKPEALRGTYQHPELYGLPADRSEHRRRMLNADAIGEE